MSAIPHDTELSAHSRARVAPAEPGNGWIKPKHGKGMLRPFLKGAPGRIGKPSRYIETQMYARQHSLEAMQTLVERLRDPDGRVAVVAANSLLERAWGKIREATPEDNTQAHIDLSTLTASELAIMVKLVESGRLRPATEEPATEPPMIDAKAESPGGK
jgi:hypothetical protein